MRRDHRGIFAIALAVTVALVGVALAQGALRGAPAAGWYGHGPGMMQQGGGPGWMDRDGDFGRMPGHGPGAMGGSGMGGYGMDGSGMGGYGMMQVLPSTAMPLGDAAVRSALQRAADSVTAGASLHDIMVFTNNVYAQVLDASGSAVGEILLDRYTGTVSPEPGPNMMWNTRWGMGSWGMGSHRMDGYGMGGPDWTRGYGPGMGPGGAMRPNTPRPNTPRPNTPVRTPRVRTPARRTAPINRRSTKRPPRTAPTPSWPATCRVPPCWVRRPSPGTTPSITDRTARPRGC